MEILTEALNINAMLAGFRSRHCCIIRIRMLVQLENQFLVS